MSRMSLLKMLNSRASEPNNDEAPTAEGLLETVRIDSTPWKLMPMIEDELMDIGGTLFSNLRLHHFT